MPKKLDDAFEVTITRIKEQPKSRAHQAMEVLKSVLLSSRQLTVRELDRDHFPSEKSLTAWCLGLVILDKETSSIRLVHKSLVDVYF
jgi:hypothetical protein